MARERNVSSRRTFGQLDMKESVGNSLLTWRICRKFIADMWICHIFIFRHGGSVEHTFSDMATPDVQTYSDMATHVEHTFSDMATHVEHTFSDMATHVVHTFSSMVRHDVHTFSDINKKSSTGFSTIFNLNLL